MLTNDPPNKKGYYSTIPMGYTFNKWKELMDYNSKAGKINDFALRNEKNEIS